MSQVKGWIDRVDARPWVQGASEGRLGAASDAMQYVQA